MIVSKETKISGLFCNGCKAIIEEAIGKINGVQSVKVNYNKSSVKFSFDSNKTNLILISEAFTKIGYNLNQVNESRVTKSLKIIISILALSALVLVIVLARKLGHQVSIPKINSQTGSGIVLLVGLLSGLHCVGMCGSFIIGYTAVDIEQGYSKYRSHVLYGAGKTLSYTIFGALFGFLGSLFHFTPLISGISIIVAGTFLILYGLNMLNLFSFLRFLKIKLPKVSTRFINEKKQSSKNPFFIGFFSGLIFGCGPLQAMYVLAAGNGNVLEGAKFLALFGLGTLPALFGFGIIARLLSNTMTQRFIQISGIMLIVLGTLMFIKGTDEMFVNGDLKKAHSCCQGKN